MPVFAEAFGYTPGEFRSLTHRDFVAMAQYLNRKAEASHGR